MGNQNATTADLIEENNEENIYYIPIKNAIRFKYSIMNLIETLEEENSYDVDKVNLSVIKLSNSFANLFIKQEFIEDTYVIKQVTVDNFEKSINRIIYIIDEGQATDNELCNSIIQLCELYRDTFSNA